MEGLEEISESIAARVCEGLLTKGGTGMTTIEDGSQPAPCGEGFDHDVVHELR